jgi:sterol desaturase/sphingolipid hydroxylase (fatty acid hydroxylase superfamily)
MATAEALFPKRPRSLSRRHRWPSNLALVVLGALSVRLFAAPFSLLPVAVAAWAQSQDWALFPWLQQSLPYWVTLLVAVLILDLSIYLQHVAFHRLPALWRLHRLHHADQDYDATTGLRFHPAEILLSLLYKLTVVSLLGLPPVAVLIFEVVLNGSALFNHANLRLPCMVDRLLRLIVVTPDMHRVHHSVIPCETDSNFGFCFPWWDRLFTTYRPQPQLGHQAMTIGLPQFRSAADQGLWAMLRQPWR